MAYFFYNTDNGDSKLLVKRNFAVTGGPRKFGEQLRQLRVGDLLLMYENGTGVVAIGKVCEEWDGIAHANVWYYPKDHHEYRIKVRWFRNPFNHSVGVARLKQVLGYQPRRAVRRIVKRAAEVQDLIREFLPKASASDEITFLEGEKRAATNTARNPQLREAAKKKYGLKCCCCGFDFEAFYGTAARGLAIVHHLKTFSGGQQRKATVKDVRVVCANCHYVIHVDKEPIDVNDLKTQIAESWTAWTEKGIRRKR